MSRTRKTTFTVVLFYLSDPWQVVPRHVFTPYHWLLISVAFVVLCRVGCLWVTGVTDTLVVCPSPSYDRALSVTRGLRSVQVARPHGLYVLKKVTIHKI